MSVSAPSGQQVPMPRRRPLFVPPSHPRAVCVLAMLSVPVSRSTRQ